MDLAIPVFNTRLNRTEAHQLINLVEPSWIKLAVQPRFVRPHPPAISLCRCPLFIRLGPTSALRAALEAGSSNPPSSLYSTRALAGRP
eukprot:364097-Chlamydomonas_euryale.AAC.7